MTIQHITEAVRIGMNAIRINTDRNLSTYLFSILASNVTALIQMIADNHVSRSECKNYAYPSLLQVYNEHRYGNNFLPDSTDNLSLKDGVSINGMSQYMAKALSVYPDIAKAVFKDEVIINE